MTSSRKQLLIGVAAAVVALAAYWMLVLSPKRDEASQLTAKIEAAQGELQAAQAQLAQYRQAKESYKTNYATVARLGKAVPEDDDVRSLVVQLEAAANRTDVDFRSIRIAENADGSSGEAAAAGDAPPPGAVVGEAGFLTMPFSFDFEGRYFGLSSFLTELERYVAMKNEQIDVTGRLLVIDNIAMTPDADGFPNVDAKIGATSYLLPPTQGATGGATAAAPAGASSTGTTGSALTTNATAGVK